MRSLIALFFLLASVSIFPAASCAAWAQYDPVLRIGSATGWKNLLFIFWSHSNRQSSLVQRSIIRGLSDDISKKRVTIMLYQIAGPEPESIRQASIFLCAPFENYGRLVTRYMDAFAAEKVAYDGALFDKIMKRVGNSIGLPKDLSKCSTGPEGEQRALALNVHREALQRNYPFADVPTFVLNGRVIEVNAVDDVRRLLLTE